MRRDHRRGNSTIGRHATPTVVAVFLCRAVEIISLRLIMCHPTRRWPRPSHQTFNQLRGGGSNSLFSRLRAAATTRSAAATRPPHDRLRLSAVFLRQRGDRLAGCNPPSNLTLLPSALAPFERRGSRLVAPCRLPPRSPRPPLHLPHLRLLRGNFQVVGRARQRPAQHDHQVAQPPRLFGRYRTATRQPMMDEAIATAQSP